MALTYGFFDSKDHDRTYDSEEMNSIFDGVLVDGVFEKIGKAFNVKSANIGMMVIVEEGRAWFNKTWSYNDAPYPITLNNADPQTQRIDAVILEINKNDNVRKNSLKVISGQEVYENPQRPTLIKGDGIYQYALCYILVSAMTTEINDSDITMVIGPGEETPYASGEIAQLATSILFNQWDSDFTEYFNEWKSQKNTEFNAWLSGIVNEMSGTEIGNLQAAILNKENSPTVLSDILTTGTSSLIFEDSSITDTSYIEFFSEPYGAVLSSASQSGNTLSLVFNKPGIDYNIKVLVRN